jgi:two-component system, LuxR family, response regulator FixJ
MSIERPLIAVVDDEACVSKALKRLLCAAGHRVETFASGAAFLKWLQRETPDCVVLDLYMPQVDGFEVQARLAQQGARVPVVAITGRDTPQARRRALAGGAAAYLAKPVEAEALLEAIAVTIGPTRANEPPSIHGGPLL